MFGVSTGILASAATGGLNAFNERAQGMTVPDKYPSIDAFHPLTDAAVARAASIAPDASPLVVAPNLFTPTSGKPYDRNRTASHTRGTLPDSTAVSAININPNIDRSYYAHELGHGVAQKTKVGNFVNRARQVINSNPRLGKAVMAGLMFGAPAVAAGLQEGDDDVVGSIGLAAALASPELVDEALASKNALAIMNDAGMRASLGQRGRLAGGYLSYLAPVLIAGGLGTGFGNLVDDKTAIYDL